MAPGRSSRYDTINLDLAPQAELTVKFMNVPKRFQTGRSREIRVVVGNVGDANARKVRVRLRGEKGVTVKPSVVSVGSMKAGGKRTLKVRVTPTVRASTTTDLTAIAGKRPLEAQAKTEIWHRKSASGGSGGGGATQLCNRWLPDITGESGGSLTLLPC